MLAGFNYHYVRPDFSTSGSGIHGVTPTEFAAHLDLLARHGEFVSAEDIQMAIRGSQELPNKSIVITFDDGLREQYEHAWPILRQKGIPAIFFVNTRPIAESFICTVQKVHLLRSKLEPEAFLDLLESAAADLGISLDRLMPQSAIDLQYPFDSQVAARLKYLLNFGLSIEERELVSGFCFERVFADRESEISRELYMTTRQIRELAEAGCIGTHSHDHLPLGLVSPTRAQELIGASVQWLEQWTGRRPFALSYPYGTGPAISLTAAQAASQHAIEFAFTLEMAGNTRESLATPLFLARFDCNHLPNAKWSQWKDGEMFEKMLPATWFRN